MSDLIFGSTGVWFMMGAVLVFFMQAGFAMVETGFTRAKNAGNIIMKNLMDFCIGTVVFVLLGAGLLLGEDALFGLIGVPNLRLFTDFENYDWGNFVFNLVFCATAATIVSGAMAERTKFSSYIIYSGVISAVVYPIEAHWVWGGGWLTRLGANLFGEGAPEFVDFAGSAAIHMVGGLAALFSATVCAVPSPGDSARASVVIEAESGEEALEKLKENPDTKVALLDIMLPGIDGFEVCRRIRATNTRIGIIMLTARSQEMDKVTGLMTGADDYVTKPFSPAELTARVDALFRRTGGEEPAQSGEIWQAPFLLNTRNRTLEKNGQRIKLTQVEYTIMRVFMENPGKALSREEILDRVWGRDYFGELKIVDVNVRRLRLKIEDNVQNPTYITTVWGYGYKWGL